MIPGLQVRLGDVAREAHAVAEAQIGRQRDQGHETWTVADDHRLGVETLHGSQEHVNTLVADQSSDEQHDGHAGPAPDGLHTGRGVRSTADSACARDHTESRCTCADSRASAGSAKHRWRRHHDSLGAPAARTRAAARRTADTAASGESLRCGSTRSAAPSGRASAYASSAIGLGSCSTMTSASARASQYGSVGAMDTAPMVAMLATLRTGTSFTVSSLVRSTLLSTSARVSTSGRSPRQSVSTTVSMPPRSGG